MSSPAHDNEEESYNQINDRRETMCEIIERDDAAAFRDFIHHEEMIDMLLAAGANAHDKLLRNPKWDPERNHGAGETDEQANAEHPEEYELIGTTLSLAIGRARTTLLRRLIEEEGVDGNALVPACWRTESGVGTLLHEASRYHNVEAVRYLLRRPEGPAMAQVRDSAVGGLPLHWAAQGFGGAHRSHTRRFGDAEVTDQALETLRALLPHTTVGSVTVDDRGPGGKTALAFAAGFSEYLDAGFDATCYDPVVRFLLENGANARDIVDDDGNTPLHAALYAALGAEGNKVATVSLLLSYGARADAANHQGDTPVHLAARMHEYLGDFEELQRAVNQNQQKIMQLLLRSLGSKSTDILDQPNQEGKTPWQIEQFTTSEITRRLKEDRAFQEWRKNRKTPYDWSIPLREQFIRDTKRAGAKRRRRVAK